MHTNLLTDDLRRLLVVGRHGHAFQRRFEHHHWYDLADAAAADKRFGDVRPDRSGCVQLRMVAERHVLVKLGHLVGRRSAALVPAPFEAERGRAEAQHYADRAAAHADGYHAGPDEPQLHRFEALLARAHERYDQAQRHGAQAHVQQRVGRRTLLQLVQLPFIGAVAAVAAERQGVVNLRKTLLCNSNWIKRIRKARGKASRCAL